MSSIPVDVSVLLVLGGLGVWGARAERFRSSASVATTDPVKLIVPRESYVQDASQITKWLQGLSMFGRTWNDQQVKGNTTFTWTVFRQQDGTAFTALSAPLDRLRGVEATLPSQLEWLDDEKEWLKEFESHEALSITLESPDLPILDYAHITEDWMANLPKGTGIRVQFSPVFEKDAERIARKHLEKRTPASSSPSPVISFWNELKEEALSDWQRSAGRSGQRSATASGRPTVPKPVLLPHEKKVVAGLEERLARSRDWFQVRLFFLVSAADKPVMIPTLLAKIRTIAGHNAFVQGKKPFYLTAHELAQFVHVPQSDQVLSIRSAARTLSPNELNEGLRIGYLQHPTQSGRLVHLTYKALSEHFVLTGATGSGKSSTLVFMMQSLLEDFVKEKPGAPGLTFIDPAEETVLILLSRLQQLLPSDSPLWEKVHYISFGNQDAPVPMNFLQVLSTDAMLELMQKQYGGGASLDEILDKSIAALQSVPEDRHVLAGMIPLLKNEGWRRQVARKIDDPILRQYWEQTFEQTVKPAHIAPVERRLRPFVSGYPALYFAQPDFALPIQKWMDEGHIVLIDVKPLGHTLMDLIMGTLIERYYQVALQRTPNVSRLHLLAVDECHRVQVSAMRNIIRETRKFGLALGLITQSVQQFSGELLDDIIDNIGTVFSNQQGPDGAKVAARISRNTFSSEYLTQLPKLVTAVYNRSLSLSIETKGDFPKLSRAPWPDTGFIENPNSTEQEARLAELRVFGWQKQRELAPWSVEEVKQRMNAYLRNGTWDENGPSLAQTSRQTSRELTADDLL
ncbi:ATP-binding protein [Alicyclobacillus tolerans]|uniref:ATP-binding protein n=1 Tax=Alicyclobacillus tolerans TaxID=90970 RepID=UPI003B779800